jgi:hypothetical protein
MPHDFRTSKLLNGTRGGKRVIKNGAATLTAEESGALCMFSTAAGYTYTLPQITADNIGMWFDFLVTTTITSVGARTICATGDFLFGSIHQSPDGTALVAAFAANGTSHLAIDFDGTTKGGYSGDWYRLTAINTTQWAVQGFAIATGTEASPFATS